ncbi:hypothetical protein PHLCEN_2v2260 [Hermanssonia centrifuga]|uniref:F-box domain-containing protein n=1 Tax=Hermanssonia centrifuga TaxID=98765 RepID=A0A2R6RPR5_9APHY|nr:hypothetical protein PHLCEN_2v2260 [Hermanssonia centrifuga]
MPVAHAATTIALEHPISDPLTSLDSLICSWDSVSEDRLAAARALIRQARSQPRPANEDSCIRCAQCISKMLPTVVHDAPITLNSLPNELLLKIFSQLVNDQWNPIASSLVALQDTVDWLAVTFVCRRWRTLAIAASELWTRIPVVTPCMVAAFAERSRDRHLQLIVSNTDRMPDALQAAMRQLPPLLHRVTHFSFITSALDRRCLQLMSYLPSLPATETLYIWYTQECHTEATNHLVAHFLSKAAPRSLRTLYLRGCWFKPTQLSNCPDILDLSIIHDHIGIDSATLVDVLRHVPRLRKLQVKSGGKFNPWTVLDPQPATQALVCLPDLEVAEIQLHSHYMERFLVPISFPQHVQISLVASGTDTDNALMTAIQVMRYASGSLCSAGQYTHVRLAVDRHRTEPSRRVFTLHAGFNRHETKIRLQITYSNSSSSLSHKRPLSFLEITPFVMRSVTTLILDAEPLSPSASPHAIDHDYVGKRWYQVLHALPYLVELQITTHHVLSHRELFRRLGEKSVDGLTVWLSSLRILHFKDLVLRGEQCTCGCTVAEDKRGAYGVCNAVVAGVFYGRRNKAEFDSEHPDSAVLWIEGLRRGLERRNANAAPPLSLRFSASSPREWRRSCCHHADIARVIRPLVDTLEFLAPCG